MKKIKFLLPNLLALSCASFTSLSSCNNVKTHSLEEVYDALKTPYKYGAVLKEEESFTDSPSVFHLGNKWYMTYITINKQTEANGYETWIAQSDDLINWTNKTKIFARDTSSACWDSHQVAGYMGFINNNLYGDYQLKSINGKHYIAYLGGHLSGYETDPLSAGEAEIDGDIMKPESYHRFNQPILAPSDRDAREGENKTIYKSYMFVDDTKTLGHKYVNFYNAKGKDDVESIFIAVSDDAINWHRYEDHSVYKDPEAKITGDPIILKLDGTYVMVYYTLKGGTTVDTFAISNDLINWTPWLGEPLIKSTEEWENTYAHKPSIVYKDGILYHFYCAVNKNNERFIAVATSKQLPNTNK